MTFVCTLPSPIGPLHLVEEDGALVELTVAPGEALSPPETKLLKRAKKQLDAYFAGQLRVFDLPLRISAKSFPLRVWGELMSIPYGETRCYGEVARAIGSPNGSRAVGTACHMNPILIVIPCHRVIGAGGALTGFGCGLSVKAQLLALEGSLLV